jgi:glycosyltransferase involved in cell wall biosynthesis
MLRRKSVLILQGEVTAYRQPIFNALANEYDVTVLHSGRPSIGLTDRYAEHIIPVREVGPFFYQSTSRVRSSMRRFDATVSMFDLRWPAFLFPVFGKRLGRFIFHGHRYSGKWFADGVRDFLMKQADCLLMYGDEEVGLMVERGIDPSKIIIAPNTMDVPNHTDFSNETKTSLLFVGRLQERKRLDLAFEIFARLQGKIPDTIQFDVVGVGEPEHDLRQNAAQLGIAHKVHFHGRIVDNDVLATFFRRAIAYISPGPVGLGVLHSFAFGVPVVTLREGRHGPEFLNLINDHNALIAPDDMAYEAAILQVCTQPELAQRLGRNAYRRYADERTLDHLIAGFRQAIEGDYQGSQTVSAFE